jgi:restriction endonuclease S subunit
VIALVLSALDDLVANARQRVAVLAEMARAIYREWFVQFRFSGGGNVERWVDSALGPIPHGWNVDTIASIASQARNAIGSGPFGSKLGRKDYEPAGIPVIRGANLRLGGGFDESDFVYVSEAKAEELRSASARRGDIVVTQRGTLGQVGRIPGESRFERYVLSQSQMKVTINEQRAATAFIYAQLCSQESVQRFVAQAMTAGVPHVNLRLLREFLVLLPPLDVQQRFSDAVAPLHDLAHALERSATQLVAIRDQMLPRLVSGQIDVSHLDLHALTEGAVA